MNYPWTTNIFFLNDTNLQFGRGLTEALCLLHKTTTGWFCGDWRHTSKVPWSWSQLGCGSPTRHGPGQCNTTSAVSQLAVEGLALIRGQARGVRWGVGNESAAIFSPPQLATEESELATHLLSPHPRNTVQFVDPHLVFI